MITGGSVKDDGAQTILLDCSFTQVTDSRALSVTAAWAQPSRSVTIDVQYHPLTDAFYATRHIRDSGPLDRLASLSLSSPTGDVDIGLDAMNKIVSRLTFTSSRMLDSSGVMYDCSRGAVPTVAAVKYLIRSLALMGLSTLQLYMEDTYEALFPIAGEPFFGYLRGRFSATELRAIDDYAFQFNIEVIPCVQTLGHLGQILQWPRYHNVRDTSEVLLVHARDTYALLERMLTTIQGIFRSRRINIGMDEAHGIGEGRYRQVFGDSNGDRSRVVSPVSDTEMTSASPDDSISPDPVSDPMNASVFDASVNVPSPSHRTKRKNTGDAKEQPDVVMGGNTLTPPPSPPESRNLTLFLDHLHAVVSICHRLGLRPMIWSDMLFCLSSQDASLSSYYTHNTASQAQGNIVGKFIPPGVDLVYWDYYHTSANAYRNTIAAHERLGCANPWMATGVWTWNRLWSALPFSFVALEQCMTACTDPSNGVRNVFATLWGDDGNECDFHAAWPGLLYFAMLCRTDSDTPRAQMADRLSSVFAAAFGGCWEAWVTASQVDRLDPTTPITVDDAARYPPNVGKWLLWEDPCFAFLSPQVARIDVEQHYTQLAQKLIYSTSPEQIAQYPLNARLHIVAKMAQVLAVKCALRPKLVRAYRAGNRDELSLLVSNELEQLHSSLQDMWQTHRRQWMSTFKPFGFEVLDLRYAGVLGRLATLQERINSYLDSASGSHTDHLEELEVDPLPVWPGAGHNMVVDYSRCCTPMRNMGAG
ncbi:hypothetical protein RI367_004813 [Sorochytrium milnesiophthora]